MREEQERKKWRNDFLKSRPHYQVQECEDSYRRSIVARFRSAFSQDKNEQNPFLDVGPAGRNNKNPVEMQHMSSRENDLFYCCVFTDFRLAYIGRDRGENAMCRREGK